MAFGIDGFFRLDARAPDWNWETRFLLTYRTQWAPSSVPNMEGSFVEVSDQVALRTLVAYHGYRDEPWASPIPDLYTEVLLATELTQPSTRSFHWLVLRPMAGLRFLPTRELSGRVYAGVQWQLLQPDSAARPGLGAGLDLREIELLRYGASHTTLQAGVDFFMMDPGTANFWQLRGTVDGLVDFAGPFGVSIGATFFLQQGSDGPVAVSAVANVGLTLSRFDRVVAE